MWRRSRLGTTVLHGQKTGVAQQVVDRHAWRRVVRRSAGRRQVRHQLRQAIIARLCQGYAAGKTRGSEADGRVWRVRVYTGIVAPGAQYATPARPDMAL